MKCSVLRPDKRSTKLPKPVSHRYPVEFTIYVHPVYVDVRFIYVYIDDVITSHS